MDELKPGAGRLLDSKRGTKGWEAAGWFMVDDDERESRSVSVGDEGIYTALRQGFWSNDEFKQFTFLIERN